MSRQLFSLGDTSGKSSGRTWEVGPWEVGPWAGGAGAGAGAIGTGQMEAWAGGAGAGAGARGTGQMEAWAGGAGAGAGAGGTISILKTARYSPAAANTIDEVSKNMKAGIMNIGGQMGLWSTTLKEYRMIDIPTLKCKICRKLFWEILNDGYDLLRLSKIASSHSETLHAESCTSSSFASNYQKELKGVPVAVVENDEASERNRKNLADMFSTNSDQGTVLVTGEFFRFPANFKTSLREETKPRTDEWWAEDVNDHPFVCTRCYMDPQVFYESRRHPEEYKNIEDMINVVKSKTYPMRDVYGGMYEALNASAVRRFHSKRIPLEVKDESMNFRNFGHVDPYVYFKLLSGQVDGIPNIGVSESGIALPLDKHRYVTASIIQPMFVHIDIPKSKVSRRVGGAGAGAGSEEEEEGESDFDEEAEEEEVDARSKYVKPVTYDDIKRLMAQKETDVKDILKDYVMVDVCVQKISVALVDQDPSYAFVASNTICRPTCGMTSWRYLPGMFSIFQIAPSTRGPAFVVPAIFFRTKGDETLAEIELALPKRDAQTRIVDVDVQSLASSSVGFAPNRVYHNPEARELFSTFPEVVDAWEPEMILDKRSHVPTNLLNKFNVQYDMAHPPHIDDFSNTLTLLKMVLLQGIPILVGHIVRSTYFIPNMVETKKIWNVRAVPEQIPVGNLTVQGGGVDAGKRYVWLLAAEHVSELLKRDLSRETWNSILEQSLDKAFLMDLDDFTHALTFLVQTTRPLLDKIHSAYNKEAGVLHVLDRIRDNVFSGKMRAPAGGEAPPGYDLKALLSGYSLDGVNDWLVQLKRAVFEVVCKKSVEDIRTSNGEAKILRRTLEPSSFGKDSGNPIYHTALPDFSSDLEAATYLSYSAICILAQSATFGTASLSLNAANRVVGQASSSSSSLSPILAGLSRTWSAALAFGKIAFNSRITIEVIRLLNSDRCTDLGFLLESLPKEVKTKDALSTLTSSEGIDSHFSTLCKRIFHSIVPGSDPVPKVQDAFREHIETTTYSVMGFKNEASLSPFCADRLYAIFELFNIDRTTRATYSTEKSVCSILNTLLPHFKIMGTAKPNFGEVVTAMALLLAGAIAEDLKNNSEVRVRLVEDTIDDGAVESAFDGSFFDKTGFSIWMLPESELLRTFFGISEAKGIVIPASVISEISILRKFAEACSTNPRLKEVYFNMRGEFAELVIGAAVGHMYADVLMKNGAGVFINAWMAAVHAGAVKRPEDLMDSTLIEISRNLGTRVDSDIAQELKITLRSNREKQLDLTLRSAWPALGQGFGPNPNELVRHVYVQNFPLMETRIRGIINLRNEELLFKPMLSRENYKWTGPIETHEMVIEAQEFTRVQRFEN